MNLYRIGVLLSVVLVAIIWYTILFVVFGLIQSHKGINNPITVVVGILDSFLLIIAIICMLILKNNGVNNIISFLHDGGII